MIRSGISPSPDSIPLRIAEDATSMVSIFADADEESLHSGVIAALAEEIRRPIVEIRPIYERVYLQLKPLARITDFLPLLVARRTRDVLKLAASGLERT
jgi:hypothetical protein